MELAALAQLDGVLEDGEAPKGRSNPAGHK